MKRHFLSIAFVVFLYCSSFAQTSLEIKDANGSTITNTTIELWGDTSVETAFHLDVENISSNSLEVKVKRIETNVLSGSMNYFCWVQCYAPSTSLSPQASTINAGNTSNLFSGHYIPGTNMGSSSIVYVFFDSNNSNDSAYVIVNYHSTAAGIKDNKEVIKNSISNLWPNPAQSFVSFNYMLDDNSRSGKISIHNMLGVVIKEVELMGKQSSATISVSNFEPGIYFYSFMVEDKVITTKRVVIAH